MKIMASGPITSWQRDGETMETVRDFILGGSKITEVGDCSHEIKRRLLLGNKVMTNLDSILKSRDITLPTKIRLVKAMLFLVVMYGCESLTVKKSWALKNWCFWAVVLKKTLETPLDCKETQPVYPKANPSWIFIGRTDAGWNPNIWPIMRRTDSFEKTIMLGRIEGRRRRWTEVEMVGWHYRLYDDYSSVWVSSRSWWWTGKFARVQSIGSQIIGQKIRPLKIARAYSLILASSS